LTVFISAQLSALLAGRVFAVAFSFFGLHLFWKNKLEGGFILIKFAKKKV
jgi:hypothetical protein